MNRARYFTQYLLALVLLASCAALDIPQPETFNQRLIVSLTAVTTARQTATTLLQADKITADDAQNVQNQTDNLRAALDIARKICNANKEGVCVGSLKDADAKLQATRAALTALQVYLTERENR